MLGGDRGRPPQAPRWIVFSQVDSPAFQQTMGYASTVLGPGWLVDSSPRTALRESVLVRPGPAYRRATPLQQLTSWIRFCWHARRVIKDAVVDFPERAPLLVAVTTPPFLPNVAAWYARRYGLPYAIVVYDTYPDHVVQAGVLREGNPLIRLWRRMNEIAFRDCAEIVTLSDSMAANLRRSLPSTSKDRPIHVIPVGADASFFHPVEKSKSRFAEQHGLQEAFVIMYSGNMSPTHNLQTLARLAAALQDLGGVRFLFIGGGVARGGLEEAFRHEQLANATFMDYQDWERLPDVFGAADLAVVSQAPGTEHLSNPSKVFPLLATGTPILALTDGDSDLGRLVDSSQAGLVFPHGAVEEMATAVRRLVEDQTQLDVLGQNALRASERFGLDVLGERFAEVLGPHVR